MPKNRFYHKSGNITKVMEFTANKWKVVRWHGFTPQGQEGDEDTWYTNEVKLENEKPERTVVERTAPLNISMKHLKATRNQLIPSTRMVSPGDLTAGIPNKIQNPLNFVNNVSYLSSEPMDEMTQAIDKGNFAEVKAIASAIRENLIKTHHPRKGANFIVKEMPEHSRSSSGKKTRLAPAPVYDYPLIII